MKIFLKTLRDMEKKYTKRFESYKNSLAALKEARQRDMNDSFVLSGTSAKFSITFELAWKVMKDILLEEYGITDFVTGSPRDTLKQAYKAGLINDETWMEMLENRNQLAHDYDLQIIKDCFHRIIGVYTDLFEEFGEKADRIRMNLKADMSDL